VIVVRFKGGLGNQLFQYAAGRALAARHGAPLRFDARWYDTAENLRTVTRTFDLPAFNVEGGLATKDELDAFAFDGSRRLWPRIKGRILRPIRRRVLWSCDSLGWQPCFMRLGSNVMLDGYFQHPEFFSEIQAQLRGELQLRVPAPEKILRMADELGLQKSVCIQVRRTDFVDNPRTRQIHGTCSPDYFRAAWEHIASRVPAARGFVFTDDMTWARKTFDNWQNIVVLGPEYDGPAYLHRFFLMKACHHFIIANSTWGWWAAWLGQRNDSVVVVPRRWLNDEDTHDLGLVLEKWVVI
jgi:hypothetical protein